jgi:ubiquinone/menaquinone biosynthesis C-methylase UbiE
MDFRTFEHTRWEQLTEAYERNIAPLTRSAIAPLLDALCAGRGMRLLDVATGPGDLAAEAAARGASAIGIDFSGRMIALAASVHASGFTALTGDAEHLPFAAAFFDLVAMNFGVLHFPHPDEALTEAWRVLKPGGRFGMTAWRQPQSGQGLAILNEAVQQHGTVAVDLPEGPGFFRFGDEAESVRSLRAAGFRAVSSSPLQLEWVLPSTEDFFEALFHATVRGGAILQAQPADAMAGIRAAILDACEPYRDGSMLRMPMPALLTLGEK